jgi:hypothetical protein
MRLEPRLGLSVHSRGPRQTTRAAPASAVTSITELCYPFKSRAGCQSSPSPDSDESLSNRQPSDFNPDSQNHCTASQGPALLHSESPPGSPTCHLRLRPTSTPPSAVDPQFPSLSMCNRACSTMVLASKYRNNRHRCVHRNLDSLRTSFGGRRHLTMISWWLRAAGWSVSTTAWTRWATASKCPSILRTTVSRQGRCSHHTA